MPESRLALQRMREFLERKESEGKEEAITRKQAKQEAEKQLLEQQLKEKIETAQTQSSIHIVNMLQEDDYELFDMETMESGSNSTVFVLA